MSIASEPKGRGITVTIKYGKGYEETWAVFNGLPAEVRHDLMEYFGLDEDEVAGLTLSEVVVNATNLAHGKGNVAGILGGTVIPSPQQARANATRTTGDVWAEAAASTAPPAEPEENPVLKLIEGATDVPTLQRIWAENQAAFADSAVMDAWKARGKALQSA
ncbi:hypothetical protein M2302_002212 [Micromonospora sp. A200]|uniref:hypothetical protein n=1 Tax=Micromonospora sp. A200 TaxID=2940568 RepID=UPI0024753D28|nr:hypothetical protein [Micromonospora sp. A200]MDH6462037.1 hypothetical protein [Micromonospora sp. A200]